MELRWRSAGPCGPRVGRALRPSGRVGRLAVLALLLLLRVSGATGQVIKPQFAREWEELLAAEDARAPADRDLQVMIRATHANEAQFRARAVRGLGRLERPGLSDTIAARLRDPAAVVRIEAAHALGQAVSRDTSMGVRDLLLAALDEERDSTVRAAIAETLGRLRYANVSEARVTLNRLLPLLNSGAALGATRGLFFLARQTSARPAFDPAAGAQLLRKATTPSAGFSATDRVRLRTVAAAALVASGRGDTSALSAILQDENPYVRREAAVALVAVSDTSASAPLILRAIADPSGVVRYEGIRAFARRLAPARGCDAVLRAVRDPHAHTALVAIDLLGTSCPPTAPATLVLDSIARALPRNDNGSWHRAAHALVSLASRVPGRAHNRLPSFAQHPNFFVRTYAAAAATTMRDTATLIELSRDSAPNVRTAAVQGLDRVAGRAADSIYIAQLTQDDSQLLMAAAAALDSSRYVGAASVLLDALDRVSQSRRETSRDGRAALLTRVMQLGSAQLSDRVRPYLTDFDPQIARQAADVLQAWTGDRPEPRPSPPPAVPLPTYAEAARWAQARAVITMANGGEVELELFPFDAPTNVARFVRLTTAGYFNSLTLHRIAPNFVVQGGSPNANEYAGDGPFTRDEVGVENWRGTVGLSTRGRDTGDGQLYFNLIDNVRLDHDYTVWGRVVRGMDVVDRMLEGEKIRSVVIR
jgi:cyclophilin family peptidyl-prolyl cis-trans isomerase/HEAT repeat protein